MSEEDTMTTFETQLLNALKRVADAQEKLLAIATEAREERLKLADQMKERFRAGFQGGEPR